MTLANRVLIGDIILPEFQRPFVWKRKQILELLDSIYMNYPIGSLLVWESRQSLESKRTIADLEVAERSQAYPVNYLLDGQQRLSAICGVIYWTPGNPNSIWNVYFDLKTNKFQHFDKAEGLLVHQIPLRRLASAPAFYKHLTALDDESLRVKADLFFTRFLEYQVPLVTLGDMTIENVAPVFERINSTGTRLTIYDLMRAATWSIDFDLGKTVDGIKSALEPKKYDNLDSKTFLRILGAAAGGDFSAKSIAALRGMPREKLTDASIEMKAASLRAADFLATQIGAPRSESLPYANQFAVLSEIYRLIPIPSHVQLEEIQHWFWRTTLSGYFGGWNSGQMTQDAKSVREYAAGGSTSLGEGGRLPYSSIWKVKTFQSNSAASKMLGLMLAASTPLDLINGQRIDVDKSLAWSNDKEYHHYFPKAHLSRAGVTHPSPNAVGNIILLTSASNIYITDKAPSEYLKEIIDHSGREELVKRMESNLVPESALDFALRDDYAGFLEERVKHLHEHALRLAGSTEPVPSVAAVIQEDPELFDDSNDDSTD